MHAASPSAPCRVPNLGGLLALGLLFGARARTEDRQPAARPALDVSADADTHIGEDIRTAVRQPASRTTPVTRCERPSGN